MGAPAAPFPRVVVAGVASGVGKTTVTVALARALRARGLRVAIFKCGPDYLDPTYHARAIDGPSHNLDGWMMGRDAVRATFVRAAATADVSLIEGVMGLYDGASPTDESGSTAEIAKWLDAPVILTVDAGGMARSYAAVVGGFAAFDPAVRLAGSIANHIGGRGHLDLLRQALRESPVLGGFPRDAEHAFPERHLGLRTADERAFPASLLDHWGAVAESWLAIDALLDVARSAPGIDVEREHDVSSPAGERCRLGIARDEAFHFYYEDNLRRLEALGATLVPFSPVHDAALPEVDGLYFGGGYPEVHAAALSANASMREAVARFAERGGPIYAECGGLMYLTRAIVTGDQKHAMVGLLPAEARMCAKLQALGYVEVETKTSTILGPAGTRFRGHQFRYSELSPAPDVEHVYSLHRRLGNSTVQEGYRVQNVLASYVHAHWASNPGVATAFVESMRARRSEYEAQPRRRKR